MSIFRNKLGLAIVISLSAMLHGDGSQPILKQIPRRDPPPNRGRGGSWVNWNDNKFPPGLQSEREMSRRVGGYELRLYRNHNRRMRGLEPLVR